MAAHTNAPILSSTQPCSVPLEDGNSYFAGCTSKTRAAEAMNGCATSCVHE